MVSGLALPNSSSESSVFHNLALESTEHYGHMQTIAINGNKCLLFNFMYLDTKSTFWLKNKILQDHSALWLSLANPEHDFVQGYTLWTCKL